MINIWILEWWGEEVYFNFYLPKINEVWKCPKNKLNHLILLYLIYYSILKKKIVIRPYHVLKIKIK